MSEAPRDEHPEQLPEDGPTELVPDERGELVERLSGGTATLLLIWLIGVGAGSALLAAWIYAALFTGERLGASALFSDFGLYVALAGASGPCVLWLAGRAQGHSLPWFVWTSARIALVISVVILGVLLAALLLFGALPGMGALVAALLFVLFALILSVIWAVATWGADRYIARARVEGE